MEAVKNKRVYDVACSFEEMDSTWRRNKTVRIVTDSVLDAHVHAANILSGKHKLKIHSIQDRGEVDFIDQD